MIRRYVLVIALVVSISFQYSCRARRDKEAAVIVSGMTLEQKIGQIIMVGLNGVSISGSSRRIIKKYLPGGIILFGFNLTTEKKTGEFIRDIQAESMKNSGIPLFISIDQEGGRVKRITDGVTQFPGNMAFGVANDKDAVYKAAKILGIQLRLLGVNMNLAPVMDVNNNPGNPVINIRSFGSDHKVVSAMGVSYIKGLQEAMCISVAKHFPGHGDTNKDSHLTLPVITYNMNRLESVELKPFIEAVDADVEAIMTAHISYPGILKNKLPATLSKEILTDLLRNKMKFEGLIISDDMEMNAVSKLMSIGKASVKSLEAGADIILISTYGKSIPLIVNSLKRAVKEGVLTEERIDQSVKRIVELKLRYNIMNFKKGEITLPALVYDDDAELLSGVENLNAKISRGAIFYHGKDASVFKKIGSGDIAPVFITGDRGLKAILKDEFRGCHTVKNLRGFLNYIYRLKRKRGSGNFMESNIAVLYHVEKGGVGRLKRMMRYFSRKDYRFIVISTGNPFELTGVKSLPPVLFAFSNTDESMKQLVICIQGGFKPAGKINVDLGI